MARQKQSPGAGCSQRTGAIGERLEGLAYTAPQPLKQRRAAAVLPLIDWAESQHRHDTPAAARRLARRFGLAPATAAALADAFGFGGGP